MLKPALLRYRITTYVVGTLLIVLTYGTIQKYTGGSGTIVTVVGRIHGLLYMVLLVFAADLARRARWSLKFTILVMLIGTVPFFSFLAERVATRRIRAAESQQQEVVGASR
jgi:integral membrane protein